MSAPKYLAIVKKIEEFIRSGQFAEGSQLPTHRELAQQMGTTAITVAKAYKALAEKKLIESFVGRGSFVCNHSQLSDVIRAESLEQEYNLSILQPCIYQHTEQLNQAFSQILNRGNDALYGYVEHTGLTRHRALGAVWAHHYGLDVSGHEQIVLACGAQHALSVLIQCYTQPGDTIAVEDLTYPGILSIANMLGRNVVGIPMDQQGMLPQSLNELCQSMRIAMVIIVPSYQNPTAATMPMERRQQIAAVVNEHQLWLVEDDIYGFLNPQPIPAITNLAPNFGFHITSLSKAISPGMRCAFIKTPVQESERLSAFIRATIWLPSPLPFAVAATLIQSGEAFRIAEQQREIAIRRQCLAREWLADYQLLSQPDSYHLWLILPEEWQADAFTLAAKNRGILVSSASYFKADPRAPTPNAIRLSLMAINDESSLIVALKQLAELLKRDIRFDYTYC
jgi:Transcriptional regulators containing a DNA-binding HTH domain and an aminotransferase domain (MocR family) and their eukaryotic orthologs